jgi:hypothetical protein
MGALLLLGLVLFVVWRVRRRSRRNFTSNVLTESLGLIAPYKGPRWRVGRRWL